MSCWCGAVLSPVHFFIIRTAAFLGSAECVAIHVPMMTGRLSEIRQTYGEDLFGKVQAARVLVVGAGGIGCELLKNLVMSGFTDLEVIDLDTIDVSNLNRQFLFHPQHVSKSKSAVARESVLKFNPNVNIRAHHGNVMTDEFDLEFFKRFSIVLNALDNVAARRHVNRLCLAAGVPLVESGSTGYLGQVMTIQKGDVECYDCRPKATQKKFPICTIRSTPSQPVHCIVWAKELFKFLFGKMEDSMLHEGTEAEESDEHAIATTVAIRPTTFGEAELRAYADMVFDAFFFHELNKKLSMKDQYKGASKRPIPVSLESLCADTPSPRDVDVAALIGGGGTVTQQKVWTDAECAAVLLHLVRSFWSDPKRRSSAGFFEFDKDDNFALDFVTAASNLRMGIFSIPQQSPFQVKGIAGNIIHAIATTNAIIAGMEVMECLKVIRGDAIKSSCKYTATMSGPTRKGYVLLPSSLQPPNKQCYVCSLATLVLKIDTNTTSLDLLVRSVLKTKLGFNEPEFTVGNNAESLFYYPDAVEDDEDGDYDFPKMAISKLPGGGVKDGTSFTVTDLSQGTLKVTIQVVHVDADSFDEKKNPDMFEISGAMDFAKQGAKRARESEGEEDEAIVLVKPAEGSFVAGSSTLANSTAKRRKVILGPSSSLLSGSPADAIL